MEKEHIIEPISSKDAGELATFINKIGTIRDSTNTREDSEANIQETFSDTQSTFDFMKNLAKNSIKGHKDTLQSKYMPLMNELYPSLKQELEDTVKSYEAHIKLFTERVSVLEKQMNSTIENSEHVKTELLTLKKNISTQEGEHLVKEVTLDKKLGTMEKISRLDAYFPGLLNKKYPAESYKKAAEAFAEHTDFLGEHLKSFMLPFVEKAKPKFKIDDPNGEITGESLKNCMNSMLSVMDGAYKEYGQHIVQHPEILDNALYTLQNNLFQVFPKEKMSIHQSIVKSGEGTLEKVLERKPTSQECERILVKTNAEFEQAGSIKPVTTSQKAPEHTMEGVNIDPKIQKYSIYQGNGKKVVGDVLQKIKQSLTTSKNTNALLKEAFSEKSVVRYINYIADIQVEKSDPASHIQNELKGSALNGSGILLRYKINGQEKSVIVGLSVS